MQLAFQNLVCGGCSFTQDGIGGVPPGRTSAGGNSFIEDPDYTARLPKSWASVLAYQHRPKSFVNVAASSHGNILTVMALEHLIDHYNYQPENTVILFNISDPARYDVQCNHSHADASPYIPWDQAVIPFSFLDRRSKSMYETFRKIDFETVESATSLCLSNFLAKLKTNAFNFAFLTMRDYTQHKALSGVIDQYRDHYIAMPQYRGLMEYCAAQNLTVSNFDYHPNIHGHRQIAEIIADYLQDKNWVN